MPAHSHLTVATKQTVPGAFQVREQTPEASKKLTKLLLKNHETYHAYYHTLRPHNHIIHHLLSNYALGATPLQLDKAFDLNAVYMWPSVKRHEFPAPNFRDPKQFARYVGDDRYYLHWFDFFLEEIELKGVPAVVNEYLFAGDARAEDMMQRFASAYLHCFIHFGYALEYEHPWFYADALASIAIHIPELQPFLNEAEKRAKGSSGVGSSYVEILDKIRASDKLRSAMHKDLMSKIYDGLLAEAPDELYSIITQWKVDPEDLELKCAEVLNGSVYQATLAQRPDKQIRFDFNQMHTVTTATFLPIFVGKEWIPREAVARILTWIGWINLLVYAEVGAPELRPQEIAAYKPLYLSTWDEIFERACEYEDDGHTSKFIRGIWTASLVTPKYKDREEFRVKNEQDFLTLARMTMDSHELFNEYQADREIKGNKKTWFWPHLNGPEVQRVVTRWPRYVGFDESWHYITDRKDVVTAL